MKELSKEALEQLCSYVDDIERNKMYYGNKDLFEKRHDEIKIYLKNSMLNENIPNSN